jgi:hypothetical protein
MDCVETFMSMRRMRIADLLEQKFPNLALLEYELQGDITPQGAMLLEWMIAFLQDVDHLNLAKVTHESLMRGLEFDEDDMEIARDDALEVRIELEDYGSLPLFTSAVTEDEMYFQFDLTVSTLITHANLHL